MKTYTELDHATFVRVDADFTTDDYGEVLNSTIVKIFGNELVFNKLERYANNRDDTTYLEVKTRKFTRDDCEYQQIRVYFDKELMLDERFIMSYSCDMFYHLVHLETEQEDEEDKDEED